MCLYIQRRGLQGFMWPFKPPCERSPIRASFDVTMRAGSVAMAVIQEIL
jgi:hypothetical protein